MTETAASTLVSNSFEWYYMEEAKRLGPVSSSCFRELIKTETIRPQTLVWNAGLPSWTQARNIAGIEFPVPHRRVGPPPLPTKVASVITAPPLPELDQVSQSPVATSRNSESVLGSQRATGEHHALAGSSISDAAAAPSTEVAPSQDELAHFWDALAGLTPNIYVTPVLIVINVLVFIVMTIFGVSLIDPKVPDLLRWGANFGPNTLNGEWWRLLTCMFVHIGFIHILLNMGVLADAGPLVERMFGNIGFLLIYLLAGLGGSLASLFWNPMLVSAGASGAIFGIYGALMGQLVRQHGSIPAQALTQLRNGAVAFLGYNLLYGLTQANTDSAAHIGGLVAGIVCGLVISQPLTPAALAGRSIRNILVSSVGGLAIIAGMICVYGRHANVANVQSELERFYVVHGKAWDTYSNAVGMIPRQEMTDAGLANIIEREVLPEWRAQRERLIALKDIPALLQHGVTSILEYMRLRQDAWELLVNAQCVLSEMEHFGVMEERALGTYNTAVEKVQRKGMTDAALADLIERDVLPDWRASRERQETLKNIPEPLQPYVNSVREYMRLRQEAWEFFVQGFREGSEQKVQQAVEKQKLADAAVQQISNSINDTMGAITSRIVEKQKLADAAAQQISNGDGK